MATKRVKYKTKSGKTAYRNIRAGAAKSAKGGRLRNAGHGVEKDSSVLYEHGLKSLGMQAGLAAGMRGGWHTGGAGTRGNLHALAGMAAGGTAGLFAGKALANATGHRLSADRRAQIGLATGIAGMALGVHNVHSSVKRLQGQILRGALATHTHYHSPPMHGPHV